jgi:hypothetical protein
MMQIVSKSIRNAKVSCLINRYTRLLFNYKIILLLTIIF